MAENEASTEKEKEEPKPIPKESQIEDIINTVKPAIIFVYIFGIFKYNYVNNKLMKPSPMMLLIGILIAVVYTVAYGFTLKLPHAFKTGNMVEAVSELPSFVVLFQYIVSVITKTFLCNDGIVSIFESFTKLDNKLCINVKKEFYTKSRKSTVVNLIILIIVHIIIGISDIVSKKYIDYFKVVVVFLYIEQDMELFIFCKLVNMLRSRLEVINEYLTKFILEQKKNPNVFTVSKKDAAFDNQYNFVGKAAEDNMKLRDLALTYDCVGETCAMINEAFNFQIFMNLISTFVYIVVSIWTILNFARHGTIYTDNITDELVTVIIWSLLTILSVGVMALSCEYLQTTRKNTKILINEIIMDYDLPKIMRIQAKAFMELIEAWTLEVFVYDMFTVDITLMLKFISVATTFLIVVIQVSHLV